MQTDHIHQDIPGGVPLKMWTRGVPVDDGAIQQLTNAARLPIVFKHIAAMPDVHVGIGATVGSVIPTRKAIIPAAVGVDIGCGMMACKTTLRAEDLPDNLEPLRAAIERAVPHGRKPGARDPGAWGKVPGPALRERVQLMTKVGKPAPINPAPGQGLSPDYIARAIDASLQRLGTDHVDVYFSHAFDPAVPQAETLGAYQRLIDAGKVRTVGASNFTAPQLREALDTARAHGLPRYRVLQPHYNLIDRDRYDGPLRDLAMLEGLAVVPYFSLASGFLTGKYRSVDDLAGSARGAWVKQYLNPRGLRILAALDAVADQHRAQPGEVALAWLMARPGVTAPIASATSVAQVDSLIRARRLSLSAADIAALDAASEPDHPPA